MQDGWIKLWRKLLLNGIIKDRSLLQVFIYCLLKANHKEEGIIFNSKEMILKPGQFITGRFKASEDLKLKGKMWDRKVDSLRKMKILTKEVTNKFTIISIINWDTYQSNAETNDQVNDQQMTNKRPTNDQQMTTDKNDKNDKKILKYIYGEFKNVKLSKEEHEKLVAEFGESGTKDKIESLSQYVASKGKKYSSHYATILSWERKNDGTHKSDTAKGTKKPCKKYDGIGTTVET